MDAACKPIVALYKQWHALWQSKVDAGLKLGWSEQAAFQNADAGYTEVLRRDLVDEAARQWPLAVDPDLKKVLTSIARSDNWRTDFISLSSICQLD